ncbi:MAG TPA: methionyl-tRNA formyltransferase [Acidimicrobiia bacterium]|nr:methionyl-tRNA formyltransferase [Acidimicrobiia bacterium]
MRIVYLGTPDDAVPPLRALVDAGHDIAFVVTQPDRRRSRGAGADASPVKRAALDLGLQVRTPDKAREIIEETRASGAELGVVVAFGQLLPVALLEALPHGFVNVHFSLLPRWRGAAPVERALLAGDRETGVCLMQIEAGLDTGPVFACERVPIEPDDSAGRLHERLTEVGTQVLVEQLPHLRGMTPNAQTGEATYAEKLSVEEFHLDPQRSAEELARVVRAGNPRPGAWFIANGRRIKVWQAHALDTAAAPGQVNAAGELGTARGALALDEVQPEGKRPMPGRAWRAGVHGDLRVGATS